MDDVTVEPAPDDPTEELKRNQAAMDKAEAGTNTGQTKTESPDVSRPPEADGAADTPEGEQAKPDDDGGDADGADKLDIPKDEEGDKPKFDLEKFSQEFAQSGELSEDSFTELENMGLPREMVQQYLEGQKALQATREREVMQRVGGSDAYQQMVQWAAKNLSKEEQATYDQMVNSGDINTVNLAVDGLHARYNSGGGDRIRPGSTGGTTSGGVTPFKSMRELVQAQKDPRYKKDPAYQREIADRLRASKI
jgi:hypothetical protein